MLFWLVLSGCSGGDGATTPKDLQPSPTGGTGGGEITGDTGVINAGPSFTVTPSCADNLDGAMFACWLTTSTSEPTTLSISIDDGAKVRVQQVETAAMDHEVLVLGLRPDAANVMTLTATGASGSTVADPITYHTDPLPVDFPVHEVISDPGRMEPGLTLIRLGPYIAMFDDVGEVRWLMFNTDTVHTLSITSDGHLMHQNGKVGLTVRTLSGAVVSEWCAERTGVCPKTSVLVDVESIHHDAYEMPNGNWLSLSIERRLIPDYPTSERDPLAPRAEAWVAGDVGVEFTPAGEVVHSWPLLDILDPTRIANDAIRGDYWEGFFGGQDTKDWSHANAIWYDEARDEVVVSLRHQDAVIGLDHATGDLSWIFAPEANWQPPWDGYLLRPADPGLLVTYHQHAASINDAGRLMLFDNGNNRASAYEPELNDANNGSRGAEFTLDHGSKTWDLSWDYGPTLSPLIFSGSLGDTDALPQTDNVLVTFGNIANDNYPGVMVFEVERDTLDVVFELRVTQPVTTFRSQRITGVIPGF